MVDLIIMCQCHQWLMAARIDKYGYRGWRGWNVSHGGWNKMGKDVMILFRMACSMRYTEFWNFSISHVLTTVDHEHAIKKGFVSSSICFSFSCKKHTDKDMWRASFPADSETGYRTRSVETLELNLKAWRSMHVDYSSNTQELIKNEDSQTRPHLLLWSPGDRLGKSPSPLSPCLWGLRNSYIA